MKNFNVQRLDNSWTKPFLNLADSLIVGLVFMENLNLKILYSF